MDEKLNTGQTEGAIYLTAQKIAIHAFVQYPFEYLDSMINICNNTKNRE